MTAKQIDKQFHDEQSIYDYARDLLSSGKSLSDIEYQLVARHRVPSALLRRALPSIQVLERARAFSETRYSEWLYKLYLRDAAYFGPPSLLLVLLTVSVAFIVSYLIAIPALVFSTFANWMFAAVVLLTMIIAWPIGWPIFFLSRLYWRMRFSSLIKITRFHDVPLLRKQWHNFV